MKPVRARLLVPPLVAVDYRARRMARKLRLGIIGTGVAARQLYLPSFERLKGKVELVACANRRRSRAEEYARLAGIPKVVDSAEELLALPEVEAVLVSLPIDLQPKYVLKALAAGKPVASEKPVAGSVKQGRQLIRAAARYGTPWLVAENYGFMPAVKRLQRWLEQGKVGDVRLVQVTQVAWVDAKNPYFHTAWRADPQHVGGYVVDAGVHLAHVVRTLFGSPRVVKNLKAGFSPLLPAPDTAVALLEFASGALGSWTSCFTARSPGAPMLRVLGSKGSADLGWNEATLRDARGKETVFKTDVNSFDAQFSHFADVVKKGVPVAVSGADALADLELIAAIVR
jgi:predicted dehydrogenase